MNTPRLRPEDRSEAARLMRECEIARSEFMKARQAIHKFMAAHRISEGTMRSYAKTERESARTQSLEGGPRERRLHRQLVRLRRGFSARPEASKWS